MMLVGHDGSRSKKRAIVPAGLEGLNAASRTIGYDLMPPSPVLTNHGEEWTPDPGQHVEGPLGLMGHDLNALFQTLGEVPNAAFQPLPSWLDRAVWQPYIKATSQILIAS
jgi:hypothetical protein